MVLKNAPRWLTNGSLIGASEGSTISSALGGALRAALRHQEKVAFRGRRVRSWSVRSSAAGGIAGAAAALPSIWRGRRDGRD